MEEMPKLQNTLVNEIHGVLKKNFMFEFEQVFILRIAE